MESRNNSRSILKLAVDRHREIFGYTFLITVMAGFITIVLLAIKYFLNWGEYPLLVSLTITLIGIISLMAMRRRARPLKQLYNAEFPEKNW